MTTPKKPKRDLNYRVNLDWGPLIIHKAGESEPRYTLPSETLGGPPREVSKEEFPKGLPKDLSHVLARPSEPGHEGDGDVSGDSVLPEVNPKA